MKEVSSTPYMHLQSLLGNSPHVNVIEWFMTPEVFSNEKDDTQEPLWIDIHYSSPQFPSIHFRNPQYLHEYRYKELTYLYDRSNDSQRTISRMIHNECMPKNKPMYIVSLQEETLPTHRFPCSANIEDSGPIVRRSFKINNRIFFIEEETEQNNKVNYVYYLRYQHAPNVDIDKMQSDLDQFLARYKL